MAWKFWISTSNSKWFMIEMSWFFNADFTSQINNVCKSAFYALNNICKICSYLDSHFTERLIIVTACFVACLLPDCKTATCTECSHKAGDWIKVNRTYYSYTTSLTSWGLEARGLENTSFGLIAFCFTSLVLKAGHMEIMLVSSSSLR